MKMKRMAALLLAFCLCFSFASCGRNETPPISGSPGTEQPSASSGSAAPIDAISTEQAALLFIDMTDLGLGEGCYRQPVTEENVGMLIGSENFTGKFQSATALTPMMMTSPFVLIVFRLEEGSDPKAFADELKDKADPQKWICVQAEAVETRVSGQTVLFFMSYQDYVQPLSECFEQMSTEGFQPSEHLVNPLEGLSMRELYSKLYETFSVEQYGFMDDQSLSAITESSGYGLELIDSKKLADSLVDEGYQPQTDEEAEKAYLLVLLRLAKGTDAKSFAQELKTGLSLSSIKGENLQTTLAYSDDAVIFYAASGSYGISSTALEIELSTRYRMNVVS